MANLNQDGVLGSVVVISPERWDEVWRRNQHLASRLVVLGLAEHVTFVNPADPVGAPEWTPHNGITVLSPRRVIPKRFGGFRVLARSLRDVVAQCDTLWINDPSLGAFLVPHPRVIYDVTDDWRSADFKKRELRRLIAAEDVLATSARTVVCSDELQRRWRQRYVIDALVVHNAVDVTSMRQVVPRDLGPGGPHVGYVGTLHDERLDLDLVLGIADALSTGLVHMVGPDSLSPSSRARLDAHQGIIRHGSVSAVDVPSWLTAFDVLICPHVVTPFTMSLDAIKAYEYLATSRPVVATPTSGFQDLDFPGLVVTADGFADAVCSAVAQHEVFDRTVPDWNDRARQFASALLDSDARA